MNRREALTAAAAAMTAIGVRGTAKAFERTDNTLVVLQPEKTLSQAEVDAIAAQWEAYKECRTWLPRMVILPAGWKITALTVDATPVESVDLRGDRRCP